MIKIVTVDINNTKYKTMCKQKEKKNKQNKKQNQYTINHFYIKQNLIMLGSSQMIDTLCERIF